MKPRYTIKYSCRGHSIASLLQLEDQNAGVCNPCDTNLYNKLHNTPLSLTIPSAATLAYQYKEEGSEDVVTEHFDFATRKPSDISSVYHCWKAFLNDPYIQQLVTRFALIYVLSDSHERNNNSACSDGCCLQQNAGTSICFSICFTCINIVICFT